MNWNVKISRRIRANCALYVIIQYLILGESVVVVVKEYLQHLKINLMSQSCFIVSNPIQIGGRLRRSCWNSYVDGLYIVLYSVHFVYTTRCEGNYPIATGGKQEGDECPPF
jgi:hypothetical protein